MLLRQSYGDPGWVAPSGGIEKGEDPEQAAVRECKEETGLILHEVALAAISQETIHGAPHTVYIFTGRLTGIPLPDGREIVEARYFDLKCLPRDARNRLSLRLTLAGIAHSSESCITGG